MPSYPSIYLSIFFLYVLTGPGIGHILGPKGIILSITGFHINKLLFLKCMASVKKKTLILTKISGYCL